MKYFTADYHFGHEEIINLTSRPWKNTSKMDKDLVKNHNDIVGIDDDIYIAGDISLATKSYRGYLENIIKKLNGRIHLIQGNHDIADSRFWSEIGIFSVHYPYLEVDEFVIVHDPSLSLVDRSRPFLCGHIHDLFTFKKNVLNVGVDVWNYKPISLDEVRRYFLVMEDEKESTVDKKYLSLMKKSLSFKVYNTLEEVPNESSNI